MPINRYYLKDPLKEDQTVLLTGKECHHLLHVVRQREGDKVELVNGQGALALATVTATMKREVELQIESVKNEEPPRKMILAQAIPRQNRLEMILEKGCELGMTEMWLFPGEKSEKKHFSESQIDRFLHILISAMKQCGTLYLPNLILKGKIKEWEALPKRSVFGDVSTDAPHLIDEKEVELLVIGPESGFTQEETKQLKGLGVKGVKLHHHILRTDTAAICGLSIISQKAR